MAVLMESWFSADGVWTNSEFYLCLKSRHSNKKTGARRWLMRSQIEQKYRDAGHPDPATIAGEIIAMKESDPQLAKTHVKAHPDLPHRTDMKLYLIFDGAAESDEEETLFESMFNAASRDNGDDVAARDENAKSKKRSNSPKAKGKKRRRSSSSSDTSDSESSGSASSTESSSDKKKKKKSKKDKKSDKKSKKNKNNNKKGGLKRKPTAVELQRKVEEEKRREEEKEERKREKDQLKQEREKEKDEQRERAVWKKDGKKAFQQHLSNKVLCVLSCQPFRWGANLAQKLLAPFIWAF